jgi:uncharacterized protein (DUF58 family)
MFKPRRANAPQLDERVKAEKLAQTLPPLILAAENLVNAFDIGVHGRRRAGTGEDFWQFKQYGPDDPTTSIDWRQSAKREHIYIRQKEQETAETVWIWRDTARTMDYGSDRAEQSKLKRATLLSLALALSLSKSGEKFGLIGQAEKASTGPTSFNRFVSHISELESPDISSLKFSDQLSNKSTVVLISDFLVEPSEITKIVSHFVNLGCRGFLMHIADPVEVDLPYGGRTRFLSMTEGDDITLGRVEIVRDDYQSLFNAHRQELLEIAKKVSWNYSFHRTDAPASEAFAALYTALNIRGSRT